MRREKRGQRSRKNEGEALQELKMLEHVLKKTQSMAWTGGMKVRNVARMGKGREREDTKASCS